MKKKGQNEYSLDDLKYYFNLPVKEKLARLEAMNNFFDRFMSVKSKQIWQKLKKKGF